MQFRATVFLLLFAAVLCRAQATSDRCPDGGSFQQTDSITREISDFQITLQKQKTGCHFEVRDKRAIIVAGDDVRVEALPEMYVLRIGSNDLILETYSSGAHCCWTYYIVTHTGGAHLAAKVQNQLPIEFLDYRGIELNDLVTADGSFAYFLGSYRYSPVPRVFLRFVRGNLRDMGSAYKMEYDKEIAEARANLTPEKLAALRSGSSLDNETRLSIECDVLNIVLGYLYSGREAQAWQEFAAMWPQDEQPQMRERILSARTNGILRYTRQ